MPQVLIISMVVRGTESAGDLFLYKDKMNLAELWILILSSCLPLNSFIYFSVCMSYKNTMLNLHIHLAVPDNSALQTLYKQADNMCCQQLLDSR